MEKINVAELLKDCPKGMELDCAIWDDVVFESIEPGNYPIKIRIKGDEDITTDFTEFGEWNYLKNSKCVIFPKGKTTWEGFVSPHKYQNGDIVITTLGSTAIIKEPVCNTEYYAHCVWVCGKLITDDTVGAIRFATESEKAELFKAIKENGYKWNAEKKTLEELIKPIFKKGDKVRVKNGVSEYRVIDNVEDTFYSLVPIGKIDFTDQNRWELVPNKFDINTLVPFESRVLVRNDDKGMWHPSFWGYYEKCSCVAYDTVRGFYNQCIPYEGNEHLIGKTDDCDEFYKTWK